MSIFIKGMEMPEGSDVLTIAITSAGEVLSIGFDSTIDGGIFLSYPNNYPIKAVPIPPHGDLIDRRDLKNKEIIINYDEWDDTFDDGLLFVTDLIDNAPTIIEAEEEKR